MSDSYGASVPDQALVNQAPAGLGRSGFDPSRVEIISLGRAKGEPAVECGRKRWIEIFGSYEPRARQHAANLAGHNWDVLLIDDTVFLMSWYGNNGHWMGRDGRTIMASAEWTNGLYDTSQHPKKRLFRDSDGSPQGGDACGSVHDSAGPQDIATPPSSDPTP